MHYRSEYTLHTPFQGRRRRFHVQISTPNKYSKITWAWYFGALRKVKIWYIELTEVAVGSLEFL